MKFVRINKLIVIAKSLGLSVAKGTFFLFLFFGSINNSYGQYESVEIDTASLSLHVIRNFLNPAVENLKLASQDDQALISWLELLEVRSYSLYHVGPGAYTYNSKGLPKVNIDGNFISKCFNISDLASALMVNPPGNIFYNIGKQYGQELVKCANEGRYPPPIAIDFDKYNLAPIHRKALETMGPIAFFSAIQYVMLHEIGHHQLNHFDRNPKDLAENREWELAADTWAIQKMQELGYCLNPLYNVLIALQLEEDLKRQAGMVQPVEYSTHPSWAQRVMNIERFEVNRPSDFGKFMAIIFIASDGRTGKCYDNTIIIPRKKMPGATCHFYQFGNFIKMPLVFFPDGSVHIYGRTDSDLSEIILTNTNTLHPVIKLKFSDLNTGIRTEEYTTGYQTDFASGMSSSIPNFNLLVKELLQLDTEILVKEYLLSIESRPIVVKQVLALQKQLLLDIDDIRLRYAKGYISFDTAVDLSQKSAISKTDKMKELMGQYNFSLLQQKLLASPMVSQSLVKILE